MWYVCAYSLGCRIHGLSVHMHNNMINKQGDHSCGYIKRNVDTMEACHQMSTRKWPFQDSRAHGQRMGVPFKRNAMRSFQEPMGNATLANIRHVGCNDNRRVHLPHKWGQDTEARPCCRSRLSLRRLKSPFQPDGLSCGSDLGDVDEIFVML